MADGPNGPMTNEQIAARLAKDTEKFGEGALFGVTWLRNDELAALLAAAAPASREGDGLPEDVLERLGAVLAAYAFPTMWFDTLHKVYDGDERLDASKPHLDHFLADLRAALAAASQGGGGLAHKWRLVGGSEVICERCHVVARVTPEDEIIAIDGGSCTQTCLPAAAPPAETGGLADGEACYLCGKPDGLPVSATGKHDACATAYDQGLTDGAANAAGSDEATADEAWRDVLDQAFEGSGVDPADHEDPDGWEGVTYAAAIRALAERTAEAAALPAETGGNGLPAWRTEELPPLPDDVKRHAVGYGTALRHALNCPMRKVIYDNHGDPCACQESEKRCERTAQMAYAAGLAAGPGGGLDREAREALAVIVGQVTHMCPKVRTGLEPPGAVIADSCEVCDALAVAAALTGGGAS